MAMMITILLVGLGSYALRVVPLLLIDRVKMSPRTEELLGHAVLAALTALLVSTVMHVAKAAPTLGVWSAAPWLGLAAGAGAAVLRQPMWRVLLIGMMVYAAVALLGTVW